MSTTVTETLTLTADDVKAIRLAEQVVFRIREGKSTLEVSLDRGWGEEPRVFTAAEQRLFPMNDVLGGRLRMIEVRGSISGYHAPDETRTVFGPEARAFEMIHSAQYFDVWKTIASLLRTGDQVRLMFNADGHSNEITRKAGLHVDTLSLEVMRGDRWMVFQVSSRTGWDNTARMIQRG